MDAKVSLKSEGELGCLAVQGSVERGEINNDWCVMGL